jgi:SAM-dependent methyltransferase
VLAVTDLSTTRAAYDAVATLYADLFRTVLDDAPLDRAVLAVFAEQVLAAGGGPVADLGCGPGHVTAHLQKLGLSAFGVDVSPEMIALARRDFPDLRFEERSMAALDLGDGALGGVLAWYSLIHAAPEEVPGLLAEFHRVTAPGGHLLLGFFQADDGAPLEPFDHKVTLAYRWPMNDLAELAGEAGYTEVARLTRQPGPEERSLHGRILARKPG